MSLQRASELCITGWVGVVRSMENSLINTVNSSDRPESLVFSRESLVKLHHFDSAEEWILTQPVTVH